MPIPTGLRNARGKKALAEVEVYKNEQSIVKRGLETKINSLWVNLQGLNNNFDLAQKNTQSMEKNAQLVQRAYTLGEADLQSLLLARRQAISANYTVLKTKSDSLKNYLEIIG
jgi:outer membrane protein TolC